MGASLRWVKRDPPRPQAVGSFCLAHGVERSLPRLETSFHRQNSFAPTPWRGDHHKDSAENTVTRFPCCEGMLNSELDSPLVLAWLLCGNTSSLCLHHRQLYEECDFFQNTVLESVPSFLPRLPPRKALHPAGGATGRRPSCGSRHLLEARLECEESRRFVPGYLVRLRLEMPTC